MHVFMYFVCIYMYMHMSEAAATRALSHARAGPDYGIKLPVLEHVFPSGPSICFRHICGLQYPFVSPATAMVFLVFLD